MSLKPDPGCCYVTAPGKRNPNTPLMLGHKKVNFYCKMQIYAFFFFLLRLFCGILHGLFLVDKPLVTALITTVTVRPHSHALDLTQILVRIA